MSEAVTLYELPPSPNNMKVRIALHYKRIPFRTVEVPLEPGVPIGEQDRSAVLEVSAQPLTPVLRHGDRAIFDSGAILRYLEANFPGTPPLFARDYMGMKEIEEWEWIARARLNEPIGIVFRQRRAERVDGAEIERANALLHELTARHEDRLSGAEWIAGDRMTAADVTTAPFLFYAMVPEDVASRSAVAGFFRRHLRLREGRERTRDWVRRVMAYHRR